MRHHLLVEAVLAHELAARQPLAEGDQLEDLVLRQLPRRPQPAAARARVGELAVGRHLLLRPRAREQLGDDRRPREAALVDTSR